MNKPYAISDLKQRSAELTRAAERIAAAVAEAEKASLEFVDCHWLDFNNRHVPVVVSFAAKIGGLVISDIEAEAAGRASRGEANSAAWKRRRAKAK